MFADFNNNQNADDFLDEFRQKLNTEAVETSLAGGKLLA